MREQAIHNVQITNVFDKKIFPVIVPAGLSQRVTVDAISTCRLSSVSWAHAGDFR